MPEEERELSSSSENLPRPDSSSFSEDDNRKRPNSANSDNSIIPAPSRNNLPQFNNQSNDITTYSISSKQSLSDQLSETKTKIQLKSLERDEKIKAINDWIGFITIKTVGISSLVVGGLEIVAPTLLTLSLAPMFTPYTLVGIGLAFLTGKKSITLTKNVLEMLAQDDMEDNS